MSRGGLLVVRIRQLERRLEDLKLALDKLKSSSVGMLNQNSRYLPLKLNLKLIFLSSYCPTFQSTQCNGVKLLLIVSGSSERGFTVLIF